ncbi:MAG TPA: hypothetical protein VFF78_06590 [Anaerolineaceae bacterium]|nr:hypothetical protein [Anaerolineaceae bacterium]
MTEQTYSIPMALMDILPNIAFLVGAFFLVKLALRERGSKCGRMLMLGSLLIFLGGTLKATWKLLMAAEVADVTLLSEQQFVLVGIGFVGMLVAVILIARQKLPKDGGPATPILAMAAWKIPFLAIMTLASLGAQGILVYISFRRSIRIAAIFFIVAVLCMLGMAGMASGEQTITRQWIEQSVNLIGQGSFAAGAYFLYKRSEANTVRC